jgi:uncharacterized protein (TIGR03435 family)
MKSSALLAWLASALAWPQQPARLSFDVASVKPNQSQDGHTSVSVDGGSLRMSAVTLNLVISRAYDVTIPQVSGPDWLATEKYDITAKGAPGTPESQLPAMLQSLLADRFGLAIHRETRDTAVYELVVAKNGPKLSQFEDSHGKGDSMSSQAGHLTATGVTMERFAKFLATPRSALDRPVVDKTGLAGVYSFELNWSPDRPRAEATRAELPRADAPPPLLIALQEQLGLKLEARKAPLELLVIDHANRVPTEN